MLFPQAVERVLTSGIEEEILSYECIGSFKFHPRTGIPLGNWSPLKYKPFSEELGMKTKVLDGTGKERASHNVGPRVFFGMSMLILAPKTQK